MRVYHFLKEEHAIINIEKSRLKIATINELNDPFEFYFNLTSSGNPLDENVLNDVKNHYDKIIGFLCFSEQMENPVLWAHYADNHKGICLEFEILQKDLLKIDYLETPLSIDSDDPNWRQKFGDYTKYKYKHWSYEKEWRMCVPLKPENIIRDNDLLFIPWDKGLSLKSVYCGLKCELDKPDEDKLMEKGINVVYTTKSRTSFSIEAITGSRE